MLTDFQNLSPTDLAVHFC